MSSIGSLLAENMPFLIEAESTSDVSHGVANVIGVMLQYSKIPFKFKFP